MGVEYRHYLIPRPNSFRPEAAQIARFIDALAQDKWIAVPGSEAFHRLASACGWSVEEAGKRWAEMRCRSKRWLVAFPMTKEWIASHRDRDFLLKFSIEHADQTDLQYPLVSEAGVPDEPYYDFEIHVARDYVYPYSDVILPFEDTACECGLNLAYHPAHGDDPFYASRIHRRCPRCGVGFDPTSIPAEMRDMRTAERSWSLGGAAYRFAVVIDCGKCWRGFPMTAHPALVDLCRQVFGQTFYGIGDGH